MAMSMAFYSIKKRNKGKYLKIDKLIDSVSEK